MTNPNRRLIVEIGCGRSPFSTRVAPGRRTLGPNEEYVGVDAFDGDQDRFERVKASVAAYETLNGLPPQRKIVMANADSLPFSDREVDEVVAANFFGDHRTPPIHDRIASEIARVLRLDGTVTVVETLTPDRMEPERLRGLLGTVGLRQLNEGREYDLGGISQYADPPASPNYGAYIALFAFPGEQRPPLTAPDRAVGTASSGDSLIMQVRGQVLGGLQTATEGLAIVAAAQQKLLDAQAAIAAATQSAGSPLAAGAVGSLGQATDHLENSFDAVLAAEEGYKTYMGDIGVPIE